MKASLRVGVVVLLLCISVLCTACATKHWEASYGHEGVHTPVFDRIDTGGSIYPEYGMTDTCPPTVTASDGGPPVPLIPGTCKIKDGPYLGL